MVTGDASLSEVIASIREELAHTQASGRGSDVRFTVDSVEVELAVSVVKVAAAEASVKVISIVSVGGRGERSVNHGHRVKVVMTPKGEDGPFIVAEDEDSRPR